MVMLVSVAHTVSRSSVHDKCSMLFYTTPVLEQDLSSFLLPGPVDSIIVSIKEKMSKDMSAKFQLNPTMRSPVNLFADTRNLKFRQPSNKGLALLGQIIVPIRVLYF